MATFNEQVAVTLWGDFSNPNPSIGFPSLVVSHSENGRSTGVTFKNDGGGHFVQSFEFAADANLPNNQAATLYADWHGLTTTSQLGMVFSVGPLAAAPGIQSGAIKFVNADVLMSQNLDVGQGGTIAKNLNVGGSLSVGQGGTIAKNLDVGGSLSVGQDISVQGDVTLSNADCAEEFDIDVDSDVKPGMVVVLGEGDQVRACDSEYDACVVGVVSGAGAYRPALVLDHRKGDSPRVPVAMLGKVSCLVDTCNGPIRRGDLLTTSARNGHAMRVTDPARASGAIIGKALQGLEAGCGLVSVLIRVG